MLHYIILNILFINKEFIIILMKNKYIVMKNIMVTNVKIKSRIVCSKMLIKFVNNAKSIMLI